MGSMYCNKKGCGWREYNDSQFDLLTSNGPRCAEKEQQANAAKKSKEIERENRATSLAERTGKDEDSSTERQNSSVSRATQKRASTGSSKSSFSMGGLLIPIFLLVGGVIYLFVKPVFMWLGFLWGFVINPFGITLALSLFLVLKFGYIKSLKYQILLIPVYLLLGWLFNLVGLG